MTAYRLRRVLITSIVLIVVLGAFGLASRPATQTRESNTFTLQAPSFLPVAHAQEENAPNGFPQDEAGISAYFKSVSSINLADVRSVFRVIEVETTTYIIGSVPVPSYPEAYDVHLYVHKDGWFLAYYLSPDPTGKIFDWAQYQNGSISTKLERILAIAAAAAGVAFPSGTHYDFRYPNATQMLLAAEDNSNGDEFTVRAPGSFAYYERSWSLASAASYYGAAWKLDGVTIKSHPGGGWFYSEGTLTPAQFLPDTTHTIQVYCDRGTCYGGLVLVYRVP